MTSKIELHSVRHDPNRMKIVEGVLPQISKDVSGLLRRIQTADNCTCRLAYQDTEAKGILVIADKISEIFGKKSLEIIALRLLNPQQDSKGIRSSLLQFAKEKAKKTGDALHITLQNNDTDFFNRHAFKVVGASANGNSCWQRSLSSENLLALLPNPALVPIPAETPSAPLIKQERRPDISEYRTVTLKNPYVQQIASGQKTIEGRINKGTFYGLKPGQRFCFFNQQSRVYCRIKEVTVFGSFREMLINTGIGQCLPGVRSLDEAVQIYDRIPGYTQLARQHGVVALRLEVETPNLQGDYPANVQQYDYNAGARRQRE